MEIVWPSKNMGRLGSFPYFDIMLKLNAIRDFIWSFVRWQIAFSWMTSSHAYNKFRAWYYPKVSGPFTFLNIFVNEFLKIGKLNIFTNNSFSAFPNNLHNINNYLFKGKQTFNQGKFQHVLHGGGWEACRGGPGGMRGNGARYRKSREKMKLIDLFPRHIYVLINKLG